MRARIRFRRTHTESLLINTKSGILYFIGNRCSIVQGCIHLNMTDLGRTVVSKVSVLQVYILVRFLEVVRHKYTERSNKLPKSHSVCSNNFTSRYETTSLVWYTCVSNGLFYICFAPNPGSDELQWMDDCYRRVWQFARKRIVAKTRV